MYLQQESQPAEDSISPPVKSSTASLREHSVSTPLRSVETASITAAVGTQPPSTSYQFFSFFFLGFHTFVQQHILLLVRGPFQNLWLLASLSKFILIHLVFFPPLKAQKAIGQREEDAGVHAGCAQQDTPLQKGSHWTGGGERKGGGVE